MTRIYVASSWRCPQFEGTVDALRAAGFDCYDFKRDKGAQFHWSEAGVDSAGDTAGNYLAGLEHPRSLAGFASDYGAMQDCDICVLVLPCNRSAHLELGWFTGKGRPTAILLDAPLVTPELMYKLCDLVTPSLDDVIEWLRAQAHPLDSLQLEAIAADGNDAEGQWARYVDVVTRTVPS